MAIIERTGPAFTTWTPVSPTSGVGAAGAHTRVGEDEYTGKHRAPGRRMFSFARMFYAGHHRRA